LKPVAVDQGTKYIPKQEGLRDQTDGLDWENGELIFLSISVEDTWRGLTQEEKKFLFNVFQQASPKTYVQYGGSDLGLFICRQLVELQGGEIGVAFNAGNGSTFSCYIKARRTEVPAESPLDFQGATSLWMPRHCRKHLEAMFPLMEAGEMQ
jgi:signal transduction histidine kinase